jgi:hypothetical protein
MNILPYVIIGSLALLAAGVIRHFAEKEIDSLRSLRQARGLLEEHHVDAAAKIVKGGEKEFRHKFYLLVSAAIVSYLIFTACVVMIIISR